MSDVCLSVVLRLAAELILALLQLGHGLWLSLSPSVGPLLHVHPSQALNLSPQQLKDRKVEHLDIASHERDMWTRLIAKSGIDPSKLVSKKLRRGPLTAGWQVSREWLNCSQMKNLTRSLQSLMTIFLNHDQQNIRSKNLHVWQVI